MSDFGLGQLLGWFEALGGAIAFALIINWRKNKDDDLYCVKREVFCPDTGVTVSEHVRRDGGCIDVFSVEDAVTITTRLNSAFLRLTPISLPAI